MIEKILSVISFIVALLSLFYIMCIGIDKNEAALLVAILGILVTALVGWNIVQYMYAKDEVRRISRKESNKAAHQAALDVKEDLQHIADAMSPLINARINTVFNVSSRAIGYYFESLNEYNRIKDPNLRKKYTSDLMEVILHHIQRWENDNKLYIQKKYMDSYVSLLDELDMPSSVTLKELLMNADNDEGEPVYINHISPL